MLDSPRLVLSISLLLCACGSSLHLGKASQRDSIGCRSNRLDRSLQGTQQNLVDGEHYSWLVRSSTTLSDGGEAIEHVTVGPAGEYHAGVSLDTFPPGSSFKVWVTDESGSTLGDSGDLRGSTYASVRWKSSTQGSATVHATYKVDAGIQGPPYECALFTILGK